MFRQYKVENCSDTKTNSHNNNDNNDEDAADDDDENNTNNNQEEGNYSSSAYLSKNEYRRLSVQFCPHAYDQQHHDESQYLKIKKISKLKKMSSTQSLPGTRGSPLLNGISNISYSPKVKFSPRKLVIHFDARNTVFVADLFSRISVEHALNTYIAGVTWGVETSDGSWKCISTSPSLLKPQEDAISLYKLTERNIVRKPEDRATLRRVLGNFTDTPDGNAFAPILENHLELLRWPFNETDAKLTVTGLDGQPYHYLLPAFYELIKDLYLSGRDFCVMVRTFGRDAPHILTAVRRFTMGKHPLYPHSLSLPVMKEEEVLTRRADGITYTYINEIGQKIQLTSEKEIYEHWYESYGVMGVVDDFEYWQNNQYHYSTSKPLWFDLTDERVHHIMFDDNIRMEDDDNIINLKQFHNSTVKDLLPQEGLKYENVYYVQADLLSSIENKDYFINMVNICQENLMNMHCTDIA